MSARFTEAELRAKKFTKLADGSWARLGPDIKHIIAPEYIITPDKGIINKPTTAKASADNSPKYKSKLERRFAEEYLEIRKMAGESLGWAHEALRFRVGGRVRLPGKKRAGGDAWYKPDFYEIQANGEIWIYEAKGYPREAAIVRLKAVALRHPFKFFLVTWDKKVKQWNIKEVG